MPNSIPNIGDRFAHNDEYRRTLPFHDELHGDQHCGSHCTYIVTNTPRAFEPQRVIDIGRHTVDRVVLHTRITARIRHVSIHIRIPRSHPWHGIGSRQVVLVDRTDMFIPFVRIGETQLVAPICPGVSDAQIDNYVRRVINAMRIIQERPFTDADIVHPPVSDACATYLETIPRATTP